MMENTFKKIKNLAGVSLLWEIILFIYKLPSYLSQFLRGLREFSGDYGKLLEALEDLKARRKILYNALDKNANPNTLTSMFKLLINDTIKTNKEHEQAFVALFGTLIAVLALFISVLALFGSKS